MFYEPDKRNHGLKHNPFKALVVPRPIGWISTVDAQGRPNLGALQHVQCGSVRSALRDVRIEARDDGSAKDSRHGAEASGEFVVNMATYDSREAMNATSATLPRGDSEFDAAGLEWLPSHLVKAPRVKRSPVHLECVFLQTLELPPTHSGQGNYVTFGRVVGVHIDDELIVDGMVDICRARPIARLGYMDYAVVDGSSR